MSSWTAPSSRKASPRPATRWIQSMPRSMACENAGESRETVVSTVAATTSTTAIAPRPISQQDGDRDRDRAAGEDAEGLVALLRRGRGDLAPIGWSFVLALRGAGVEGGRHRL